MITIIGGGASGMMAAIAAAREGAQVTIIEQNTVLGRKLLATGNGRCNFTNKSVKYDYSSGYLGSKEIIASFISHFNFDDTVSFFKGLGVISREENQRLYPYSLQGTSICNALEREIKTLGVRTVLGAYVSKISMEKKNQVQNRFVCTLKDGREVVSNKLIIATGGLAGMKYGYGKQGYDFARTISHHVIDIRPALTQLICSEKSFKELKGVRARGKASLYRMVDNKKEWIEDEHGEIQFTQSGLSGICIFNLSSFCSNIGTVKYVVDIDFMPEYSLKEIESLLKSSHEFDLLYSIVKENLAKVLIEEAGFSKPKLAKLLKSWTLPISGLKGWEDAQVTSGGIDLKEINSFTMESLLCKGLYFTGEIVDVDGICGGYNLQWAWTSGALAGKNAGKEDNK